VQIRKIIPKLHELCLITGIMTFAVALFGGLSLRFGYKLIIFQFIIIYALQAFAMLASNEIFLIVTNVFDGLFSGGLIVILSELSAELAYPVGESISLGFIYACESMIRFIIKFTVDISTFTTIYDPEEK